MADSALYLREQAERCRRLAADCSDKSAAHSLRLLSEDFTVKAVNAELELDATLPLTA